MSEPICPLIHPADANEKCDDHRLYVNREGAKLLIGMLQSYLRTGQRNVGFVQENQQAIKIEVIPSTQEDFDCGSVTDARI